MDVAVTARREQQTYTRNLWALRAVQPALAAKLTALDNDEVIPLEAAPGGRFTARIRCEDEQQVLLASRHDPVAEAARWVDGLEALTADVHTVVVAGLGLGYHIAELLKRRRGGLVVVLEPWLAVLHAALRCCDFAAELGLRRLVLAVACGREELFAPLGHHGIELMLGTKLTQHPASVRARPAACAELQRAFTDHLQFIRSALVTSLHISETTCGNILRNLPAYLGWPGVGDLKDVWAGKPGFCVAAGPSLRKNMHLLREVQGRFPIIAVQTLLKTLVAANIRPDFVTTLDYSTQSQRFYQDLGDVSDVTLIAEPKVNSIVPDHWPGPLRMAWNSFGHRLLREMADDHAPLPAGATVAHLSFYLARYMGCDPIVLVGQDLGYDGNVYYAPGTPIQQTWSAELNRFNSMEMMEWQRIARLRSVLQKVPDIHGRQIYTDAQMFTYLQQFERDIAATEAAVIDATEGGALIAGTSVVPLKDVLERYCGTGTCGTAALGCAEKAGQCGTAALGCAEDAGPGAVKCGPAARSCGSSFSGTAEGGCATPTGRSRTSPPKKIPDARERFGQAITCLRARLDELDRMDEVCVKVLEPLRQMTDALDDVPRFNRLHARMDRWRVKIDDLKEVYHLVSDVVQLAELKRVQMDKAIDRKELDEIAERRDQLARDIQYVSILQEGIASLRKLIHEAIARLEGPWP